MTPDTEKNDHNAAVHEFCDNLGREIGHPVGYANKPQTATEPEHEEKMGADDPTLVNPRIRHACVDCMYFRIKSHEWHESTLGCLFGVIGTPEFSPIKGWKLSAQKCNALKANPEGYCANWVRGGWLRRWWSKLRA